MKIRQGFVSNSSSASYTILVNVDKDEFYSALIGSKSSYSFFYKDDFVKEVKEDIMSTQKWIKEMRDEIKKKDKRTLFLNKMWVKDSKNRLIVLRKTLKRIKSLENDSHKLAKEVLEYNGMRIDDSLDGSVVLNYWTSMHNSYTEALPEVLQEVILIFLFTGLVKIKASVDHEGF